jgi:glutamate racemase
MSGDSRAIGVFDSGIGGLTVYKALRDLLPREDFLYLGDTARLPYGTKSPETVGRYAVQAARLMMVEDIKLLVIACNTASALALSALQEQLPELPCIGVIEPGAKRTAEISATGRVAVLATESTVRSGAYAAAIARHRPEAKARMLACNLLVALAEEGWCEGAEAEAVIGRYLRLLEPGSFDTLVLGCTHFPLLIPTMRKLIAADIPIVDSAATTAAAVRDHLEGRGLLAERPGQGNSRFWVTDSPERFAKLAPRFLDSDFRLSVNLVDTRFERIPAGG